MFNALHLFIYIFIIFLPASLFSQSIVIKDAVSKNPVADVSFFSTHQSGTIPASGLLPDNITVEFPIYLSHVLYETFSLDEKAYKIAVQTGVIYLQPSEIKMLQPVTVLALRGKGNSQSTQLGNTEWIQHDGGQVLQQMAGFSAIRKSGTYAADPVFRGFKQEQLTIVNDGGLSANAACPNRMDPPTSQIMMNQVEEIEVLKGPHSFRYGPSMGAVINFKSAAPQFENPQKVFGRVNTGYETNGQVVRTEGVLGFRTQKWELAGLGSYSTGNDYKAGNGETIPSSFSRGAAGVQVAFQPKKGETITGSAIRNFARDTRFPTLQMDLLTDDTWMLQAGYKKAATQRWYKTWQTQAYASIVDHTMGNRLRPASAAMLSHVNAETYNYGGRTEFEIMLKRTKIFTGADFRYEFADGYRTRSMLQGPMAGKTFTDSIWQKSSVTRGGLFADLNRQVGKYKLHGAIRTDVVNAGADNTAAKFSNTNPQNETTDINLSMSVGANRQWNSYWTTGLWVGRGTRSAGITERFINFLPVGADPYEMVGNPLLNPEVNYQADLGVVYRKEKTQLELNVYYSMVDDYISSVIDPTLKPQIVTSPGVRRYINIEDARRYGFELSWMQDWLPNLSQTTTLSYVYGQNKTLDQPLAEIPPMEFRYRLQGKFFMEKIVPFGQFRYVAAQNRVAADFGEKPTGDFTTIDLGISFHPTKSLQFSATVNNLTDATYREHLSRFITPQLPLLAPGRSLVIMGTFRF